MALDNRFRNRETQAASRACGGPGGIDLVETVEDVRQMLRRDAANGYTATFTVGIAV